MSGALGGELRREENPSESSRRERYAPSLAVRLFYLGSLHRQRMIASRLEAPLCRGERLTQEDSLRCFILSRLEICNGLNVLPEDRYEGIQEKITIIERHPVLLFEIATDPRSDDD